MSSQEVDPTVEAAEEIIPAGAGGASNPLGNGPLGGLLGGAGGMGELASAIPGIDEAMSFGEMIK